MKPLHLLHVSIVLVITCVVGAFGLSAWRDYRLSVHEMESSLMQVTRLMSAHVRTALLSGNVQLARVADLIDGRPLPELEGSLELWNTLRRYINDLPFADSFWVVDRDGLLRLFTLSPEPIRLDLSDRSYFTSLRTQGQSYVSPMIWGRLMGGFYFAVSQRLNDRNGQFNGVAQLSIKANYFTDFYKTLQPSRGSTFAIYRPDGQLVVSYPLPDSGTSGTFIAPPELIEQAHRHLTHAFAMDINGVRTLHAVHHMEEDNLLVVASMPMDQALAPWWERSLRSGMIGAVILAALVMIAVQLSHAFRREEKGRARAEALLADKLVLFQEIHHRVKNNLQIISSFLTMQVFQLGPDQDPEPFEEALSRIHSMGLVHQTLYEQNEASDVSMDSYLQALTDSMAQGFGIEDRHIQIRVDYGGIRLSLERAVPLALLSNEIVTNALKHAFPQGRGGTVSVGVARDGHGACRFRVQDDGIGLPDSAQNPPSLSGSGLGMHIISALVKQLDGTLSVTSSPGETLFEVVFPGD